MSESNFQVQEQSRDSRNNLIALLMVVGGSFLVAFNDAMNYAEGSGERAGVLGLGGLLLLGSIFFVRRLKWWLLLYIPGVWIASGILAVMLSGVALQVASGVKARDDCAGMNKYWDLVEDTGENINARMELVKESNWMLSQQQWQILVNANDTDVENLRAYRVPKAASEFNLQLIRVLDGWSDVFKAASDGTYTNQMLFELQAEDDEMENLQRQLAIDCS